MKCICIRIYHSSPSHIDSGTICDYEIHRLKNSIRYDVSGVWFLLTKKLFDEYFMDYDEWIINERDKKLEELV